MGSGAAVGGGSGAGVPVPSDVGAGAGTGAVAASELVGVGLLSGVIGSLNAAAGLTAGRCAGGATAVREVGVDAAELSATIGDAWVPRVWLTATMVAVTRTAAAAATTGR